MSFMGEFKEFIAKGNVMDMAVGVVVGGAFTAIVNSLVKDVITPAIALVTKLFQNKAADVAGALGAEEQANKMLDMANWIVPGTEIKIGAFLQSIISFLIVAFIVFCVVKGINNMRAKMEKKQEEAPAVPAGPTQEELLTEIRDLLKK